VRVRTINFWTWLLMAAVGFLTAACEEASDDSWIYVGPDGRVEIADGNASERPHVSLLKSSKTGFVTNVATHGFRAVAREVLKAPFQDRALELRWPDSAYHGEIGDPAIPVVRKIFVVPGGATVSVSVVEGDPIVVDLEEHGLPWRVMPVQAPVEKRPGAFERAPFDFNREAYTSRAHLLDARAVVQELGIVRGQRLFLLEVRPIAYDPAARTLTLWPNLQADLVFEGARRDRESGWQMSPMRGTEKWVLNADQLPEVKEDELRDLLIVVDESYAYTAARYASHKAALGYNVRWRVVDGESESTIKGYISEVYQGPDGVDFVLLVGDTDTIDYWWGGGSGSPATDLQYGCMDGSGDWYPDIAVGRFSVRSTSELDTIIDKSIAYESGPYPDLQYTKRAVFMAGNDNYSTSQGSHNWVIENYMDPNGYTSDKNFEVAYGATRTDNRNSFDGGRIFGVYSGHGSETGWSDGPSFYASDVDGLTNEGMYSFVWGFACDSGTFTRSECFTETWLRASGGGAISAYGSTVSSYWTQDDVLERRLFDSMFDTTDAVPTQIGAVWNDARMRYLEQMGSGSTTRRYFEMYNQMGDPTLYVLGLPNPS
jgi:hypothetical protein